MQNKKFGYMATGDDGEKVFLELPQENAFPQGCQIGNVSVVDGGMTLRDYFAAKALSGILSTPIIGGYLNLSEIRYVAESCYKYADEMIRVRSE